MSGRMQITDHVHALKIPFFVASPAGEEIPRFVYCYLICGREICLVDSGVAGSERMIGDYLLNIGRSVEEISTLILTHSHPDHIGGAAAICSLSNCSVLAHEAERAWIEDVGLQAEERPVPGFGNLVDGSVRVDRTLEEGQVLHLDDSRTDRPPTGNEPERGSLQVLHTPGHSPGSICLWMAGEGVLFSADAVPIKGDMPIYQDYSSSVKSIRRLAGLPGINYLLAAWDGPRCESASYAVIEQSLHYLESINSSVLHAARANPGASSMQICRAVLSDLNLPGFMANPLVAASFQSSLRAKYKDEERIIWLWDRERLADVAYVREKWQFTAIRTGPAKAPLEETLIGYTALKKTAEKSGEEGYFRRIFTLRPDDRPEVPCDFGSGLPPEAVNPLEAVAGRPARRLGNHQ